MSGARPGLDRRCVVGALLHGRGNLLVVTGLGSATYDVFAAGDHNANIYLWGAMGGAALAGLGLALAQPSRPVLVVTGDGEQLMGMGGLATIAVSAPPNLSVVVLDNGHYAETGMQLSHTGHGVDLCKVAGAVGFPSAIEISDEGEIEVLRKAIHANSGGPRFAAIRISNAEMPRALPARDGVFIKMRFRTHLGLPVS